MSTTADGSASAAEPSAFLQAAGLEPTEIHPQRVRGTLTVGPDHHTPWGVVHGGVLTAAVESAASLGASAAVRDKGQYAVGLSQTTDFLRPTVADTLEVLAEPVQQGRTQQLWRVLIHRHSDGKLVCQGQLRLQNVPLTP